MASAPRILQLLQQVAEGKATACSFDLLLIKILDSDDYAMQKRVAASVELREVRALLEAATRDPAQDREAADLALLSYRSMVAAEEARDRKLAIEEGRKLLSRLKPAQYPRTAAFTNLKIGTSLAAMSSGKPAAQAKLLTEAVQSLNAALTGLSPKESAEERFLALYNLVMA